MLLLSVVFAFSSFAAKMDKEFACYQAMNRSTRAENVIMDNKVAVHPIDGFSFFTVSAGGIQKCRVPAGAPLAPDGREGAGPWLVRLTEGKTPYHIQYPRVVEHHHIKGAPGWAKPECSGAAGSAAKVLENRIADSRQACGDGPKMGECLADFVSRLKSCEGIPAVRDYVMEMGRSAAMHARPASGSSGGQPPPATR